MVSQLPCKHTYSEAAHWRNSTSIEAQLHWSHCSQTLFLGSGILWAGTSPNASRLLQPTATSSSPEVLLQLLDLFTTSSTSDTNSSKWGAVYSFNIQWLFVGSPSWLRAWLVLWKNIHIHTERGREAQHPYLSYMWVSAVASVPCWVSRKPEASQCTSLHGLTLFQKN